MYEGGVIFLIRTFARPAACAVMFFVGGGGDPARFDKESFHSVEVEISIEGRVLVLGM